jgi:transcriptional regulator with XRE-family HTH domain
MKNRPSDRDVIRAAFGVTIRGLRRRKGISQERLALEANVERAYMSGLERGLHTPTLDMIFRLLPVLGIRFAEFAGEFEKSVRRLKRLGYKEES